MSLVKQRGNFAIVLCLLVGVFAIGGIFFLAFSGSSAKREIASDPKSSFDILKARVEQAMNNPATVDASVERNPNSFACLYTTQADCLNKGGVFLYYETIEPSAQPISQLMKNAGVGYDGIACTGFPSADCAFRIETSWVPVCAPGKCESTKSLRMISKVIFNSGVPGETPLEWGREELYSPGLKLSAAVQCEREGRIWAETECLTTEQVSQRNVASAKGSGDSSDVDPAAQAEVPAVVPDEQAQPAVNTWVCPNTIVLQGLEYYLENIQPGRAQVHVPAVNGCPNAADTFIFQCVQKTPAAFEGEGQWVQVEAQMAAACQGSDAVSGGEPYSRQ